MDSHEPIYPTQSPLWIRGDKYGGIFNGKWGEVDVKNKNFSIKGISTTTINQEGKILFQKDYYDMYGFMKQLGLLSNR